ncbi:Uncharacterised protein [uncultured archaeon]|nr:Uncharacterised protein [uncultured archaeon]
MNMKEITCKRCKGFFLTSGDESCPHCGYPYKDMDEAFIEKSRQSWKV